ncbi:MAG: DUF3473 domain-containing protein [Gemmatimonadota bacterium]
MRHHLTVDVEEFFHSTLLTERIPEHAWGSYPRRAPVVVPWILERLAEADARATFFVLGWTAERDPDVVREIHRAGHEVAAHSWRHRRVDTLDPETFRDAVRRCKNLLEDITGEAVSGYRAPSFSITPGKEWAFDVLLDEGFTYDSSIYPIDHGPAYGYPGGHPDPHVLLRGARTLVEVPILSLRVAGRRWPAAGGAYLRLLPLSLVRSALRQTERRGVPGTLYIHPWDIDPDLDPVRVPPLLHWRLFGGAARARRRLAGLIEAFPSACIRDTVKRLSSDPTTAPT